MINTWRDSESIGYQGVSIIGDTGTQLQFKLFSSFRCSKSKSPPCDHVITMSWARRSHAYVTNFTNVAIAKLCLPVAKTQMRTIVDASETVCSCGFGARWRFQFLARRQQPRARIEFEVWSIGRKRLRPSVWVLTRLVFDANCAIMARGKMMKTTGKKDSKKAPNALQLQRLGFVYSGALRFLL